MKIVFLFASFVFVILGIFKNKDEKHLKQTGVSIIVLSILNAITLSHKSHTLPDTNDVSTDYLVLFSISGTQVDFLYNASIGAAIIGLIIYLFSDVQT